MRRHVQLEIDRTDLIWRAAVISLHRKEANVGSNLCDEDLPRHKWRLLNRNLVRPKLRAPGSMSTATWLIQSIHNLRQMQAVPSPCTAGLLVGIAHLVATAVAVQWNERVSTYVYYNGPAGGDNYDSHNVSGALPITF
jgi:hypothetical protein